ncbi:hypothetical protein RSW49_22920, partial [Escherichia coli]
LRCNAAMMSECAGPGTSNDPSVYALRDGRSISPRARKSASFRKTVTRGIPMYCAIFEADMGLPSSWPMPTAMHSKTKSACDEKLSSLK